VEEVCCKIVGFTDPYVGFTPTKPSPLYCCDFVAVLQLQSALLCQSEISTPTLTPGPLRALKLVLVPAWHNDY